MSRYALFDTPLPFDRQPCAAALARPSGWWACANTNCDGDHYFRNTTPSEGTQS